MGLGEGMKASTECTSQQQPQKIKYGRIHFSDAVGILSPPSSSCTQHTSPHTLPLPSSARRRRKQAKYNAPNNRKIQYASLAAHSKSNEFSPKKNAATHFFTSVSYSFRRFFATGFPAAAEEEEARAEDA